MKAMQRGKGPEIPVVAWVSGSIISILAVLTGLPQNGHLPVFIGFCFPLTFGAYPFKIVSARRFSIKGLGAAGQSST